MVTLRTGDDGYLLCSFKATPQGARIVWKKAEDRIAILSECSTYMLASCQSYVEKREKYDLGGNLTSGVALHIKNVTLADSGDYECKVTTRGGVEISRVHASVMGKYIQSLCNLSSVTSESEV